MTEASALNLRRIVVVGRDAAVWLCACALKLALSKHNWIIEVIELPSTLRESDVYVSHPPLEGLHRLLGLDEHALLSTTGGAYNLGYNCINFAGADSEFFVPHGEHGHAWEEIPFLHHWLRAEASGLKIPLSEFSLNAVAALRGRFFIANPETSAFQTTDYAYSLRALTYSQLLKSRAQTLGVRHYASPGVNPFADEDGNINRIELRDGTIVTADLVIDASGGERAINRHVTDLKWVDWRKDYPFSRSVTLGAEPIAPLPAYNQIKGLSVGVLNMTPVQGMTSLNLTFHPAISTDKNMAEAALVVSGLQQVTNVVAGDLPLGILTEPWSKNVVSIGESFVGLDGLGHPALQIVHLGIAHLISALTAKSTEIEARAIFNVTLIAAAISAKDFQLCHYHFCTKGLGGAWNEFNARSLPPSLSNRLQPYLTHAIVPLTGNKVFLPFQWTALLVGLGVRPPENVQSAIIKTESIEKLNFLNALRFIREQVESMHTHDAYVEIHAPFQSQWQGQRRPS